MKNAYVKRIWEDVQLKNADQSEFLQAVQEVLTMIEDICMSEATRAANCLKVGNS